jgi:hypothetical protein
MALLWFQSTAQYRLEKLYDHACLERVFLPVMLGEGRSPTLYILDRRGGELLKAERGYDVVWHQSSKELSTIFLHHSLAMNDVMVAVSAACRNLGYELERWITESEIKADYDRVSVKTASGKLQQVAVLPDSFFAVIARGRRYPFCLELDRGTMQVDRFKDKIRAYRTYHQSGKYEARFKVKSIRVLTVISTKSQAGERRLKSLKQATEEVGGEDWFWFATLTQVKPETALSALFGEERGTAKPML